VQQLLRRIFQYAFFPAAAWAATVCAVESPAPATSSSTSPATLPTSLEERIASIIDQFSDADAAVRDDAQEQILDMGEPARKFLMQAAQHADSPESRLRIAYTLRRLGLSPRPTRLSLHLKNVSASKILDALAAEGGVPLLISQPAARARLANVKLSFDADRLPYWLVMRRLCNAVKLKPDPTNQDKSALSLVEGQGFWSPKYTSVDGVFAVHV